MKKTALVFNLILLLALVGCTAQPASQPVQKIRFAVLPVLDVFPLYAAQEDGLFKQNGVDVELVPVASAPERDQLMQAGQIDGMLNETVATLFYNQGESRVNIVRFARVATDKYPLFRILAAGSANIKTPADLKGVEIGVSNGTVIEYTTDRLLEKAGLTQADIQKVSIPKIPDRMSLLASGQLKAANLPDPTASLALKQGAVVVIDDTTYPEISNSVLTFSTASLKKNPEGTRAFLKAVEQAVKAINADKNKYKEMAVRLKLLPQALAESYTLPDFPQAGVPTQEQFNDALTWAKGKGLKGEITYAGCVDASFLPK